MNQPELPFNAPPVAPTYPVVPGFKAEGTSRLAADAVKPRAASLRSQAVAILKTGSFTADEVAAIMGKTAFSIRPRVTEAGKLGLIYDTGRTRPNASGKEAVVWRAWG